MTRPVNQEVSLGFNLMHANGFHTPLVCCSEWRSGVAGHLILSDEDLTSVVQGNWKRLNTLQHYKVSSVDTSVQDNTMCFSPQRGKSVFWSCSNCTFHVNLQVPDGATVALVPRHSKHIHHDNHDYVAGESELVSSRWCLLALLMYGLIYLLVV